MSQELLSTIVSVVLGGGFIGSIVALIKLRPEGDQIIVSSVKDVVLIQKGAIEDLQARIDQLERRLDDAISAREKAEADLGRQTERNARLAARVAALEAEVAQLRPGG